MGVLSKYDALQIAKGRELDLVLVSPSAETPVGRIIDYSKFKYEKSKKARKAKTKNTETKEWWFKATIEERDIMFKLEDIKKYVTKGGTAKLTVKFVHKIPFEVVKGKMDKIVALAQEMVKPISEITKEGRNLSILVKSK